MDSATNATSTIRTKDGTDVPHSHIVPEGTFGNCEEENEQCVDRPTSSIFARAPCQPLDTLASTLPERVPAIQCPDSKPQNPNSFAYVFLQVLEMYLLDSQIQHAFLE